MHAHEPALVPVSTERNPIVDVLESSRRSSSRVHKEPTRFGSWFTPDQVDTDDRDLDDFGNVLIMDDGVSLGMFHPLIHRPWLLKK